MGRKVGTRRSDRRYLDDHGTQWASEFESRVYHALRDSGNRVRKCDDSDSIAYNTTVKQGRCLECGSSNCVQQRTYTPDLYVVGPKGERPYFDGGYYIECKGYFPADKRSLLRAVANQATGIDLRIVFQRVNRLPGTKLNNVQYVFKYLKGVTPGVFDAADRSIVWYERTD